MTSVGSATPTPTKGEPPVSPASGPHKGEGLAALLAASGLIPRGTAALAEPLVLPDGSTAKSVILIGHAGSSIWPHFSKWLEGRSKDEPNPLDTWSKEVIGAAAREFGGHAVFPSDKPYLPFQQWAMMAEGLKPSPLGMLIHPVYGLWHAYRGAVLFSDLTLSLGVEKLSHPCDTCIEKPCLSACPVNAFSDDGFAVGDCRTYLTSHSGHHCMDNGCQARGACPVGMEYAYVPGQMRFHMRAFSK